MEGSDWDEMERIIVDPPRPIKLELQAVKMRPRCIQGILPPRAALIGLQRWPLPLFAPPNCLQLNSHSETKDFFLAEMEPTWVEMDRMEQRDPSNLSATTLVACALGYGASFPFPYKSGHPDLLCNLRFPPWSSHDLFPPSSFVLPPKGSAKH